MISSAWRSKATAESFAAVGALALIFGSAWYAILMRPVWAAAAYGPICAHGSLLAAHCASCYAALGLAGLGLGLLAAGIGVRRSAALPAL